MASESTETPGCSARWLERFFVGGFQPVQERGSIKIKGRIFEQRGHSFFLLSALRMSLGSLDEKMDILLF